MQVFLGTMLINAFENRIEAFNGVGMDQPFGASANVFIL